MVIKIKKKNLSALSRNNYIILSLSKSKKIKLYEFSSLVRKTSAIFTIPYFLFMCGYISKCKITV